ncbi:Fe2OG dioxygenase domain-containing protein [Citrus sinensis]|nr:Fe2OG dioxygenase domain-containing protein [Citrus sinensis]
METAVDKKNVYGGSLPVENVQALASNSKEIPSRYIRPELDDEQVLADGSLHIPVIDMSKLQDDDDDELAEFHLACKDSGFLQLINHGVPEKVIEKMKTDIEEFFKLPLEEKMACAQLPNSIEGYGQAFVVSKDQKLDWGDMLFLLTQPANIRTTSLWPTIPTSLRATIEEYSLELQKVTIFLLKLMAKNLGIEPGKLASLFEDGIQGIRMNYYPPCAQANRVIGLTPHSDSVALTLLVQVNQVQGLQVKKYGKWVPVKPIPGAFIINIGDIIEIMSNGEYKSIEHRAVVNPEKERLSVAAFHSPNMNTTIGPLPNSVEDRAIYKNITHEEFIKLVVTSKLDALYGLYWPPPVSTLSAEERINLSLNPPKKSFRRPPKFTNDPSPEVQLPPPRIKPLQRQTVHNPSTQPPHISPNHSHADPPSQIQPHANQSPTSTASILSKLQQPTTPNAVSEQKEMSINGGINDYECCREVANQSPLVDAHLAITAPMHPQNQPVPHGHLFQKSVQDATTSQPQSPPTRQKIPCKSQASTWDSAHHQLQLLTTEYFQCSEELSIVSVWVSFPYLPIHCVQCKEALFSIALAVGKLLRIDQATASLTRPFVARILSVVYGKIPPFCTSCTSCKHLGHAIETCYVANPGFCPQRPNGARQTSTEKGKETRSPITIISPVENQADITEATAIQESQVQDTGAWVDLHDHGRGPRLTRHLLVA